MAESMKGLKRSHRCTEVSNALIGQQVTLMGWVQKRRNLGSLIFVDLRDRSGLIQLIFDEDTIGTDGFAKAGKLRSEFVIAAVGTVEKRSGAVNENLKTGDIEIKVSELRILSEALTPPFPIDADISVKEDLRLKYRYLDLRRPNLQKNLMLRSKVATSIRSCLTEEGFLEIETPILTKSTPEGARDYLVPSRVHPGTFYALPQSPQIFKQLLMCSGYDRYFQIAKCFRDEDLRADRQPEFTQIDMELSFVDVDDVIEVNEKLLHRMFKDAIDFEIPLPIPRMTWQEAMDRFGSDKPDIRFGMELVNVTDVVKDCEFVVFQNAIAAGGTVRGINVKGQGDMPRKKIDALVNRAKEFGAKGLAYVQMKSDGSVKASFSKFMKEEEMDALVKAMDGETGDLLLFAADKNKVVWDVLGNLRLDMAKTLELTRKDDYRFVWITEFPLLEWSEEENRYTAMHHPFTMPMEEDLPYLDTDPGRVRAKAYDIVLNGTEIGGGSVRIFQDDVQEKMFECLGFTKEQAYERFGFLMNAFKYGVPPHAGLAYGFDRLIMLMAQEDSIRDVIAFPKVKDASCLMSDAPGEVDQQQLTDLCLAVDLPEEKE
ncbi:MAG: aspartate--tRNA ligase [Lachnospiraceae bacterium]|nr:aspartate--tRNA ligase [Lachnospiraceae bacterium]